MQLSKSPRKLRLFKPPQVLNETQRALAERYWPLARHIAKRDAAVMAGLSPYDRQMQLESAGQAVCLAALQYNPLRGVEEKKFMMIRIRHLLIDMARSRRGRPRNERQRWRPYQLPVDHRTDDIEPLDASEAIYEALGQLRPEHRQWIELRHLQGLKFIEAGRRCGLNSDGNIGFLQRNAEAAMRRALCRVLGLPVIPNDDVDFMESA